MEITKIEKKMPSIMPLRLLCAIYFCLFLFKTSSGQSISWSPGGLQNDYVKHFQIGRTIPDTEFFINITGAPPGVGITASSSPGGELLDLNISGNILTLNGNLSARKIGNRIAVYSSGPIVAHNNIFLEIQLSSGGQTSSKIFHFINREPNDIVFLLDRSGSMGCDYNENTETDWPNCAQNPVGDSYRWGRLESAVQNFVGKCVDETDTTRILPNIGNFTGDRMGIAYFSGTTATPGIDLTGINAFSNALAGNMNLAETPLATDGTSIGNGIMHAITRPGLFNSTATTNRRQALFLFTDGEQNAGNWVKDEAPDEGNFIETSATNSAQVMNLEANSIQDIEIYSIGLVETPAGGSTLSHIADATSRHFNILNANPRDFPIDFGGWAFHEFFRFASPQTIGFEKHQGVTPSGGASSSFFCNDRASRMIIEVYFEQPFGKVCSLFVTKDGQDAMQFDPKIIRTDYIATVIFDLTKMPADFFNRGTWKVVAQPPYLYKSQFPIDFKIFATADDHKIKLDGFLKEQNVRVGDKITPVVTLEVDQKPVSSATVKAIIFKPGNDLSTLLAEAPTPNLPDPSSESSGCDGQKYQYLLNNDTAFRNKINTLVLDTIELVYQGQGTYSAEYSGISVSGLHKILYWIRENHPALGLIERVKMQSVYVNYGRPDSKISKRQINASKDNYLYVAAKNNQYYFSAAFQPTYKNPQGNTLYVGPGFEHQMRLEGNNVNLNTISNNNCNGEYEFTFSSPLSNPKVKVFVNNELFYNGRINGFDGSPGNGSPWGLSLHAGLTIPTGNLDSLYNPGVMVELDLHYRINLNWDVEALFGYYGFSSDFSVLGGSLLAGYRQNLPNGFYLRPAVGLGVFKPENIDATIGYIGKIELLKNLTSRLEGAVHAGYITLPDPQLNFLTAGIGIKYRF